MSDGSRIATRESLADRARGRLARWEPLIRAFVAVDDRIFGTLDTAEGALAGVAVGVKDVVRVAGFPTRNGSLACSDAPAESTDASVVAALRRAGAAVIGKTTTTEFAFTDPAPTLNPYSRLRTPGGSSAGSAAAVGAGVLDLSVGTQTAGSLCRPAAYCGVVGFKPGFGRLPVDGMTPLAPSFDTIGFIARSVDLAALAYRLALGAAESGEPIATAGTTSVGLPPVDFSAPMIPEALEAAAEAARTLRGDGLPGTDAPSGVDLARVVADHRVVMLFEAAALHGRLLRHAPDRLRPNFAAALREGMAIEAASAGSAGKRLRRARDRFWDSMSRFDVLVAPPVPGTAPLLDGTTGYQHLLTPWTVFGGPLICLPWGVGRDGMPRSVMLAAAPGSERRLLAEAARLARLAPVLPAPEAETGCTG